MRIQQHPVLDFKRGKPVSFTFDGQVIDAFEGETVAVALHAAGVRALSHSLNKHRARGLYCAIGNCSSCMMIVDGEPNVKVCLELVRDGMDVRTQPNRGVLQ
jgi:predicted molibdopterin-dependent oxidoreductase YjgC